MRRLDLKATPPADCSNGWSYKGPVKPLRQLNLPNTLIEREKKSVMVVSADVYRPAAIAQLEKVAGEVGAEFFPQ